MFDEATPACTGARLTVARKMNAELYGGPDPPSPATILDYRRTKRPPPFERLAAVRACLADENPPECPHQWSGTVASCMTSAVWPLPTKALCSCNAAESEHSACSTP